ncbi:hypothetical protein [Nonomuraea sp. NPDC050310]|uniref:hypothetical protein n=1 Tax=Nonomuraea sp. NPDC050310 TaxID=3154935 RepID=UPI0033F67983
MEGSWTGAPRRGRPGATSMVTPSSPAAPRATTSITSRTDPLGPTTGCAGRTTISLISGPAAAAVPVTGTASAPAMSEVSRTRFVMINTVGTAR